MVPTTRKGGNNNSNKSAKSPGVVNGKSAAAYVAKYTTK